MNSVKLNISDRLYPSLMNIFNTLPQDEVEIIENKKHKFIVSSKKEIKKRLKKAEKSIANGGGLNEIEAQQYLAKLCPWLDNEDN